MPTRFFPLIILYANPCVATHSLDGYSLIHYTKYVSSPGYPPYSHLPPFYLPSPPPLLLYVYTSLHFYTCFLRYSLFANFCRCFLLPSLSFFVTRFSAAAGLYCLLELSPYAFIYRHDRYNAMTPFLLTIRLAFGGLDEEAYSSSEKSSTMRERYLMPLDMTYEGP